VNLLRSFVDLSEPKMRGAVALFAAAAAIALVPLAAIAYVLVDAAHAAPERSVTIAVTCIVLAAAALQIPLAAAGSRLLRASLDERAERLRVEVVEHLRLVPARTAAAIDPGHVLGTMTLGLDQSVADINGSFDAIFGGLFKAAGCIAIVAWIDWRIALVSLAFLPFTIGYLRRSRASSARATPRMLRAQGEGTSRFYEYLESIALLRAFGCTAERMRRLTLAVEELNIKAFETTVAPMTFGTVSLFFIEFGFAIALTVGIELGGNAIGIGYILAFAIAMAYFQTLFEALDGYLRLRDAAAPLATIERLLDLAPGSARSTAVPQRADLSLDGISFAYDRGEVLRDVSIDFPERAVTAVVGASGAGKSTLASVISGIWEPNAGTVRVGGVDLATLAQSARAQTVSIVFQDATLFEETIERNIGAGRPEASAAEIREAGRVAGCDEFVLSMPQGYQTAVRPDGSNLSLGERQRIAIARMLLSPAPIVVLDECTASLDAAAERAVHDAIATLADRKTVVLVTHRLGTVRHAAGIVVLQGGRVAARGTHEQLLESSAEYARLWAAHERSRHWKVAG
jgi:ATP-binding cassette subfamily B protein